MNIYFRSRLTVYKGVFSASIQRAHEFETGLINSFPFIILRLPRVNNVWRILV